MSEEVTSNIKGFKLNAEVLYFSDTVESVLRASTLTGMPVDFIVKTMLLKVANEHSNSYLVVLVRGDRRIDMHRLSRYVGCRIRMASRDEVLKVLNVEPGAVSPLLSSVRALRKLVDPTILRRDHVICGGGTLNTLIKIAVRDLLNFLGDYEVVDVFK